jgi:hypothetical protein
MLTSSMVSAVDSDVETAVVWWAKESYGVDVDTGGCSKKSNDPLSESGGGEGNRGKKAGDEGRVW